MSSKDFWPDKAPAGGGAAKGTDIEEALRAAEDLDASATQSESTELIVTIATSGATTVAAALAAGEAAASHWAAAAATVAVLLANIALAFLRVRRIRATAALRHRLANDLVVAVRAVFTDVVEREQWGEIRTQAITTRLSRFPIRPRDEQGG